MTNALTQLKMIGIDPREETRFLVTKRDGRHEEFNEARIFMAIEAAFRAALGLPPDQLLPGTTEAAIMTTTDAAAERVLSEAVKGQPLEVERIQDVVEEQLMRDGHWQVARRYILYREERRQRRQSKPLPAPPPQPSPVASGPTVAGSSAPKKSLPTTGHPCFQEWAAVACQALEDRCSVLELVAAAERFTGIGEKNLDRAMDLAAESLLPFDPAYDTVAARLILQRIYHDALPHWGVGGDLDAASRASFADYINEGVNLGLLQPELNDFDLNYLAQALHPERDAQFTAAGLRAFSDEFVLRDRERAMETPQFYWMRLAMGLAVNEGSQASSRAIDFYEALSTFCFVPSAPILYNAGTTQPHLTASYEAGGWHDLEQITQRVGGRMSERQKTGLTCAWLEPWHASMPDFLARPRPGEAPWQHDLNKGIWVPDLFMKRVREGGRWTLFDVAEVPDLHRLHGRAFEKRYLEYEAKADRGEIKEFRQIAAVELWREIVASLIQTGQPWLAFKDAINVGSLQDNGGGIRSGLLGTGTLVPSSAGCAVGAINLAALTDGHGLDRARLRQTVTTAIRMLDNALDLSLYPTPASRADTLEQRPVALGITGFQDALYQIRAGYNSPVALDFADQSMELLSWHAITASSALAQERGPCAAFTASKWSGGTLPCDTLPSLEAERGLPMTVGRSSRLDWSALRETIRRHGLRQNAITAISPALEGSVLAGVTPSVEPATRALFGPGLRGTRGAWNRHLVADLKRLLLWNNAMLSELRENEFSVQGVQRIPALIRELYLTQFELDPRCLLECAARRQKWLDLGQSLNLAVTDTRVDSVSEILFLAWEKGLKLTNQLRVPLPPPRPVRPPKEATKPAQPEPVRQQEAVPA